MAEIWSNEAMVLNLGSLCATDSFCQKSVFIMASATSSGDLKGAKADSNREIGTWERTGKTFEALVTSRPFAHHRNTLGLTIEGRKRSSEYYDPSEDFAIRSLK